MLFTWTLKGDVKRNAPKELDVISDYEQSFQAVGTLPFLTINKRILFHVKCA